MSAFWSTVEYDADAVATTFASPREAAEAVVIGELAGDRVDITRMDPEAVRELISPTLVA